MITDKIILHYSKGNLISGVT